MSALGTDDRRRISAEALEAAIPAATQKRTLQAQILLLADFEFTPAILRPQRDAFPAGAAPPWPPVAGDATLDAYAESCSIAWFWGRERIVDPARPYFLVGFGRAGIVAMEMGRQLAALARPPAGVIQIGEALKPTGIRGWIGLAARRLISGPDASLNHLLAEQRLLVEGAASANAQLLGWADSMVRSSANNAGPAPFPVFTLVAKDGCDRSEWLDNQRCQVRGAARTIGVTHAAEVNAFIMRIVLSSVRGLQLDPGSTERAAARKLDRLADLLARESDRTA